MDRSKLLISRFFIVFLGSRVAARVGFGGMRQIYRKPAGTKPCVGNYTAIFVPPTEIVFDQAFASKAHGAAAE
jgi:hypothetical protein